MTANRGSRIEAGEVAAIGRRALAGERINHREALVIAGAKGAALEEALRWAWQIRQRHFGDKVRFCSIFAGKLGGCGEDCRWCAQSASHSPAGRAVARRAAPMDVVRAAREARSNRAGCFSVVNSGRRPTRADLAGMARFNAALRKAGLPPACASMGELDEEAARALRRMGVRRYHHNLETSRGHFARLVSTHSYDDRLRALSAAREAGMELCCGGLFGTGDTWSDRVELALTLRDEVKPQSVPLNFLSPIPGTPLERMTPLSPMECLHIIALFRFVMPAAELQIAGGRANLRDLQSWVFRAGASGIMVGNYLTTTSGRDAAADRQMVEDLGMKVVR
jgi:biotin synthase